MKFDTNEKIVRYLNEAADADLKRFNEKIFASSKPVLGVKVPDLRKMAQAAVREGYGAFVSALTDRTFEEVLLFGLAIGYASLPYEERLLAIDAYLKRADSWAHIDCAVSTFRFIKKDKPRFLAEIGKYLASPREFEVRFAFVALLWYYAEGPYLGYLFDACDAADCAPTYVSMAVAWLLSVCYVKFPSETRAYLERTSLDELTVSRAYRKILDSSRVARADKEEIKKRRKNSK